MKTYRQRYYAAHRAEAIAYAKTWMQNNRAKFRVYMKKSRQRPEAKEQRNDRRRRRNERLSDGVLRGHARRDGLELTPQNLDMIRQRIIAFRSVHLFRTLNTAHEIARSYKDRH